MKTFTYLALVLALVGMASAFFKPAQPVQAPNNAVAMNAELFGLDNPGAFLRNSSTVFPRKSLCPFRTHSLSISCLLLSLPN